MEFFRPRMFLSCTLVAILAAAPGIGMADGMAGNGQTGDPKSRPATTGQGGAKQEGTAGSGGGQKGQAAGQQGQAAGQGHPVVYMLVPVAVAANDNAMKSGCWTRIYSNRNYTGDSLTLTGPVSIADMDGPFGLNWDDRVESIEVGPKATVTVFDNEAYRDQVAQFKPGQRTPDISKPLGFFDEFASIRINCAS